MALYRQIAGFPIAPIITDTGTFTDPRLWNPLPQFKPPIPTTTTPTTTTITPSQPLGPNQPVNQGGIPTPLPPDPKTAITNNILPLIALAGVILVAIKGDDLLHEKRKIALLGGLGLLYYGMAKNKLA